MVFRESSGRGFLSVSGIANAVVRFIQIIAACVVIGYYGSDLNAASKRHKYSDSKWVFAVVVGSMSAISALIFLLLGIFAAQLRLVAYLFGWEWILVILWAAVSGLFGSMYFNENPEMDKGVSAMITAAGFDLANLILWIITACIGTLLFFWTPKRTLHTGRGTM